MLPSGHCSSLFGSPRVRHGTLSLRLGIDMPLLCFSLTWSLSATSPHRSTISIKPFPKRGKHAQAHWRA